MLVAFAGLQVWIGGYHPTTPSQDDRTASTSTTRAPAESVAATTTAPTPEEANSTSALDRWVEALLYGARTIIGLNPTPPPDLNRVGEVLLIVVRVLGPLLLGLAVLALRGRVKR